MSEEYLDDNKVILQGEVDTEPEFSHILNGEEFFQFNLKTKRLSEVEDIIPISISSKLKDAYNIKIGDKIAIKGQFRSYNKMEEGKSRLLLRVFCKNIMNFDLEQNSNQIELNGYICKKPIYRITPFSREICDVLLAVNRNFGKSDYIPCIAWGRNAQLVNSLPVGSKISLIGRIQSREYTKKIENTDESVKKVAYEVSASNVCVLENEKTQEI
ncbi:MAG: single-stranded DNA-binding protein [Clostridia bacterium]|nr:single-stranded DNA-binding protein [Clostridia bacterium]